MTEFDDPYPVKLPLIKSHKISSFNLNICFFTLINKKNIFTLIIKVFSLKPFHFGYQNFIIINLSKKKKYVFFYLRKNGLQGISENNQMSFCVYVGVQGRISQTATAIWLAMSFQLINGPLKLIFQGREFKGVVASIVYNVGYSRIHVTRMEKGLAGKPSRYSSCENIFSLAPRHYFR